MCDHQTYCMYLANLVSFFVFILSYWIHRSIIFAFEYRIEWKKNLCKHLHAFATNMISLGQFYRTFYLAILLYAYWFNWGEKLFDDSIMFGECFRFYRHSFCLFFFAVLHDIWPIFDMFIDSIRIIERKFH